MAKMIIGTYTLPQNPSEMDPMIRPQKSCSYKETYAGVAYFSWGTMTKGLVTTLTWPFMRFATFASLDAIFRADAPVTLNPQDGTGRTYTVEIMDFRGRYSVGLGEVANYKREDISMKILILARLT